MVSNQDDGANASAFVTVPLLENDQVMYTDEYHPTSTITWFQGDPQEATKLLTQQALRMIQVNPWLAGRLLLAQGNKKKVALSYPVQVPSDINHPETAAIVVCLSPKKCRIHTGMKLTKLEEVTYSVRLTKNRPHELVWQVLIVPCCHSPHDQFAIIMSLSHVIGDGFTFYRLHNMLCFAEEITELIVDRIPNSDKLMEAALGVRESQYMKGFWYTAGVIMCAMYTLHKETAMKQQILCLDTDKIQAMKAEHVPTDEVPFVSTNDIIFSWFCKASKACEALMIVNFRNRLDGFTMNHAGNYIDSLLLLKPDFGTPSLVRQSLAQLKRVHTHTTFPSFLQAWLGDKIIVSNWVTFKKPCQIPHCEEGVHAPLFDAREFPLHFGLIYVIARTPTTLGIHCVGRAGMLRRWKTCPFATLTDA
jgi:hypothetical protein